MSLYGIPIVGVATISLLAGLMIVSLPRAAFAQTDMGAGYCSVHGNYTGPSCPSCSAGGSGDSGGDYHGPNLWNILRNLGNKGNESQVSPVEQARRQRIAESYTANQQGVEFYNKGNWVRALALFQEAVNKDPNDPICRRNLANAQNALRAHQRNLAIEKEALQTQRAEAEKERLAKRAEAEQKRLANQRDKAAAHKMQQIVRNFSQTIDPAQSSGGPDFDGRNSDDSPSGGGLDFISTPSTSSAAEPATALEFGDPMVVDARNVPSGLSKSVENAIASAYSDAPPGVSDRVRKGFQAVADRDWKVAKAWFEDALNRDPGNAGLKGFVALVDQTPEGKKQATSPRQDSVSAKHTITSLNASASKMSTEQVMKALADILAENISKETPKEIK